MKARKIEAVFHADGIQLLQGEVREVLRTLEAGSVQVVATSPPYWGLRDYGLPAQKWANGWKGSLGLEPTPWIYVENMVEVFREVRRVLRDDGTLWLNIGNSYAHGGCGARDPVRWPKQHRNDHMPRHRKTMRINTDPKSGGARNRGAGRPNRGGPHGFKPKDLVPTAWMVAMALQADGWYLRSDIVWDKPNAMPSSVKDRPTSAHEFLFLLSKRPEYQYDWEAIKEKATTPLHDRYKASETKAPGQPAQTGLRKAEFARTQMRKNDRSGLKHYMSGFQDRWDEQMASDDKPLYRNKRDVWRESTARFEDSHFAVWPPELVQPCILAGSKPGQVVLDPFSGSGTTMTVAHEVGRHGIGIDLNPEYNQIARDRLIEVSRQRRLAL